MTGDETRLTVRMRCCAVCESSNLSRADDGVLDFEYASSGSYTYWRCEGCALLNIDPVPSPETLGLAYPDSYHAYHPHATRLARILKKRYWSRKAARLTRLVPRGGSVLDVGCATGDLLVELKALGVTDVTGIDFNERVVALAREKDVNVFQGDFDTCSFDEKRFDLIVMTNFIEHVYDPIASMRRARDLLKPGGQLVGETPNWASWDYYLFRRYWGGYHTPRHLHLFNRSSLGVLGERSGFVMRGMTNILQPAHWALSVQNRLQASRCRLRMERGRTSLFAPLILTSAPVNLLQMVFADTSLVEFLFERTNDGL